MQAQKIAVGPPQSQEMSAQLLVANSSNFPSGSVPTRAESVGTGVFAPLNTVHVRYRGVFVETFKCCGKGLKEYLVKPCVRGFGELPNDHEFDAGELSLVVDDYNPGCNCLCFPCCYKRLTLTAKDKYNGLSFTMERPRTCPIPFLCWPFNCTILCPLKLFVRSTDGDVLGYAEQVTKCCNCSAFIKVFDAANHLIYTLQEPCCQNCCLSGCLPNLCCKKNKVTIHPGDSGDRVGEIVHTYPGCVRSLCSGARNFFVAFPPNAGPDHKALLMGSAFMASYLWFGQW
ncbi:hypothetical protein ABBQ32_012351 [Trebouxia sp. C0010 RCD-2024]